MELSLPLSRRGTYRRGGNTRGVVVRSRRALELLRGNRIALRATLALLVVLPVLAGGWLWLRDSSFVAVRHVHITGVHGAEAVEIRNALDDAAKRMSTMDFNAAALRSAVASFAIVGAVRVKTELPHTVSISVTERPPVAALQSAGQRTAVAADGTVLGPAWLSSALPLVSSAIEPAAGARLSEGFALEAVTLLGAAPPALAKHVKRVYNGPEGLTVAMGNGLLVYFGDSTRPHAKWMSLARVLASPNSASALYVDVRLPERPAAGFTALATSSATTSSSSSSLSTSSAASAATASSTATSADPTAAALAMRLSEAAGGEAATSTSTATGTQESEEASSGSSGSSATGGTGESEASTTTGSTGSSASEAGGTAESETASAPSESASATGGETAPEG
jgi:cell division protein FtsQ